ncbi:MAG: cupredoxin domain-containing protein [Solirubrobacteraceae bacterium]
MNTIKRKGPIAAVIAAVVCGAVIVPISSGASTARTANKVVVKKVKVADDFFAPTKLTIKKGNQINFVWQSTNYETHNVTLRKGPKGVKRSKFTSINAVSGIHFKRTFLTAGTYRFVCTIHPGTMNLTVVVKR